MQNPYPNERIIEQIGELPEGTIVHDISFDWSGNYIAAACDDRTVRIYAKQNKDWREDAMIKIQTMPALKVKWARAQYGLVLATSSLDRRLRVFEQKKVLKEGHVTRNQWQLLFDETQQKIIEDIKFSPKKTKRIQLAVALSNGAIKIYESEIYKLNKWENKITFPVGHCYGLNCLSWSKQPFDDNKSVVAVGCKTEITSHKQFIMDVKNIDKKANEIQTSTLKLLELKNEPLEMTIVNCPALHSTEAINDLSFALVNGRSYNLLAVASQTSLRILELKFIDVPSQQLSNSQDKSAKVQVLKIYQLSDNGFMRVSWNVMGTYLAASSNRTDLWRAMARGKWQKIDTFGSM